MGFNASTRLLLASLYDCGAIKVDTVNGFKLKSHEGNPTAPLSPIFFNLRTPENPKPGPLTPKHVEDIAQAFVDYARNAKLSFGGIAGVPRAGEPFAEEFQSRWYHTIHSSVPRLVLDKIEEGGKRHIGKVLRTRDLPLGEHVLLLDDLATKAESKEQAAEQLKLAGYEVRDCLVFLDRQQGAAERLDVIGLKLHSIVTITEALEYFYITKRISTRDRDAVLEYLNAA